MKNILPYDLLVTDLDGTLLNQHGEMSARTLEALQCFQRRGGQVSLATGRMESAVQRFAAQIECIAPLILYNGAKIVSFQPENTSVESFQTLHEWVLPDEKAHQAIEIILEEKKSLIIYSHSRNFVLLDTPETEAHFSKEKIQGERVDSLDAIPLPITKLLVIDNRQDFETVEKRIAALFDEPLNHVRSESNYWEVLPMGVNKGTGLHWLMAHMNIAPERVIAFGDQLNDLSLLQEAGTGVAMGNANPQLKAIADRIAPSNAEDGLARIVEEICQA